MKYTQPHLVFERNEDGTWGRFGLLESYFSKVKDPYTGEVVDLNIQGHPARQWEKEAALYKTKFGESLKQLYEMRKYHLQALDKIEQEIGHANKDLHLYDGLGFVAEDPIPQTEVVDVSSDRSMGNDNSKAKGKRKCRVLPRRSYPRAAKKLFTHTEFR